MLVNSSWYTNLLLILTTSLIFIYILITKKNSYWKNKNIPGPKPLPLVGNLWKVLSLQKAFGPLLKEFYDTEDGPLMGIFTFGEPILLVKSPEIVKQICSTDFQFFNDRLAASPKHNDIVSNSLLLQKNPEWKSNRTKITPIFSSAKLKVMFDVIKGVEYKMVSFVKGHTGKLDGKQLCYEYATEVVSRCFFGINANCFGSETSLIKEKSDELFEITLRNVFCQSIYFFKPYLVDLFHIDFFSNSVEKFFVNLFWECMRKIEDGKMSSTNFIGFLRELREKDPTFDGNKMAAQGLSFFAAGTETTSSTISFVLYELCMNPNVQSKLRQEIENLIKENGGFTYEALQEMKYLEICVIESLRKYPPLAFLDRRCNTNYKIPGTDVIIEKGTGIYIPLLGIQNDSKYFLNPENYFPERFIENPEASKMVLSFGFGPRRCIGGRFGMLSVKMALVFLLKNFEVKRIPETPTVIEFSAKTLLLASKVGLPMKFVPIETAM